MVEVLIIICLIAVVCIGFVTIFPVSVVKSQTRISKTDKRHPRYHYHGGNDYDDS